MVKVFKNIISKNRKKVGFTLVEILAVIVILGIIIAIFVTVSQKVLDFSYEKAYNVNLESLENAGKEFIVRNNIKLENEEVYIISMEQLKSTGVIEDIIDPETKLVCEGYVLDKQIDSVEIVEPYLKCEGGYITPGYGNVDNQDPLLNILGENPTTILKGSSYTDAGATAIDNVDGDLTSKIEVTSNLNTNVFGTYSIIYTVKDKLLNESTATRTVYVNEEGMPTVEFSMNGNNTYAQSRSTTVTVSDEDSGVNESSLRYEWTTSQETPNEEEFSLQFTNGNSISTPAFVTGEYYLWILARDIAGNTIITRTNVFKLDNTKPVITINGPVNITINTGTSYTDAGATATDNIDGNITVTTSGSVNVNLIGPQVITYTASDTSGNTQTATRTVNVLDATAPVITIKGSNPVTVGVGGSYTDAGATAMDNPDGNLTSMITTTSTVNINAVGTYYVQYRVKDNSNNQATSTRTVYVVDNTPPTITINGSNPYNYVLGIAGNYYSDAGATAYDNVDGNITSRISVESNVNTGYFGTYYITYTVTDNAGNTSSKSRTININQLRVEYLIVAGGGAGGAGTNYGNGGGGGAGGYIYTASFVGASQGHWVDVGGGGSNGGSGNAGNNGGNSAFLGNVAIGGGGGGGVSNTKNGRSGGSGGGASASADNNISGSSGTAGQGNNGGNSCRSGNRTAGGGGGATGGNYYFNGGCLDGGRSGDGGTGIVFNFWGSDVCYAAGGGGGIGSGTEGYGGTSGWNGSGIGCGAGRAHETSGGDSAEGATGSGGGGGKGSGGNGGSGIVIIRYYGPRKADGGEYWTWNGYNIHRYTGSAGFYIYSS